MSYLNLEDENISIKDFNKDILKRKEFNSLKDRYRVKIDKNIIPYRILDEYEKKGNILKLYSYQKFVSNFINQCLKGENITIYGDGSQTRSFCYVSDLVQGLVKLMTQIGYHLPVNLGNPEEYTIYQLAEAVMTQVKSNSLIEYCELPEDDPKVRKPDITKARDILGWEPRIGLTQGLQQTINYFLELSDNNN